MKADRREEGCCSGDVDTETVGQQRKAGDLKAQRLKEGEVPLLGPIHYLFGSTPGL